MRLAASWDPPEGWLAVLGRRLKLREGWLTVILVVTVMLSTVWSVEAADWVSKLPPLGWIALAAMAFGLLFAKMHRRGLVVHPVAFLYGLGIVTWQTLTVINLPTWDERFVNLVLRLNAWGYAARTGGINNDSLVFVFTLAALAWLIGYLSMWFVFRSHRIWWGVVPSGVAILMNLRYAPSSVAFWFVVYLLASMLLFVRMSFFLQERNWEESRITYAPQMSLAYLPTAILICSGILAVAWLMPTAAMSAFAADTWHTVSGPWQDFQGDFNRLFASLSSPVEDSYSSFGRTMILKGPVSLSNRIALVVNAEESHYWRATSYDTYVGQGWLNNDKSDLPARPNSSLTRGRQYEQRKEITQTVSLRIPKNDIILAAGQPVRLSLFSTAETTKLPVYTVDLNNRSQDYNLPPDVRQYASRIRRSVEVAKANGTLGNAPWPTNFFSAGDLPPDVEVVRLLGRDSSTVSGVELMRSNIYPIDILSLRAPQHLKSGQEYTVVSSVSTATEKQLRTAGTSYPSWVTDRYLQMPLNFPRRVTDLAEMLTRSAANPYDKALAIQDYLRKIKYNQNIDAPPATMDPVEYFLFVSREGYCDYYASAMVMMLRSQGIPARIATGYLPGTYDQQKDDWVVRESNAHAWPEVFFPRYGWIEFEPTASVSTIFRSSGEETAQPAEPAALGGEEEPATSEEGAEEDLPADSGGGVIQDSAEAFPLAAGLGLLVLAVLVVLIWLGWQRSLATVAPVSQVYEKMCRLAGFAGLGPKASQTPYEYAGHLGQAVPESSPDVKRIADVYSSYRFGRKTPSPSEARGIDGAWRRIRNRLIRKIVTRR